MAKSLTTNRPLNRFCLFAKEIFFTTCIDAHKYFLQSYATFIRNFFTFYTRAAFNFVRLRDVFTHTLANVLDASDFSLLLKTKQLIQHIHCMQLFETLILSAFVETCQFQTIQLLEFQEILQKIVQKPCE